MDPGALLARVVEQPAVATLRAVLETYGRAAGGLLASGLAFSALFAAISATLLLVGLAGWIASGDPALREEIRDALVTAFPPLSGLIEGSLEAASDGAALTSGLGIVGLLWTVSRLIASLDIAVARIFADEPERNALRRTVRGFVAIAFGAAAVAAAVTSVALFAAIDLVIGTPESPARGAMVVFGSPVFLALAACLLVISGYRALPPSAPSWHALVIPAVLVGAILVILAQAFAFVVPRLVGVAELAGSLASVFVALAWLSLSFQALLLGAAWVRVREERVSKRAARSMSLEGATPPAETGGGRE